MGPAASNAVPALTKILVARERLLSRSAIQPDDSLLNATIQSFERIGVPNQTAIACLARLLSSPGLRIDIEVRLIASRALWKLDGQTNTHIRVLLEALAGADAERRWRAVTELGSFARVEKKALAAVTNYLTQDENHRVRGKAAQVLGELGPVAAPAIPALTQALQDSYLNVRDAAAEALRRIQQTNGEPTTARREAQR
jgi:HEAT repeat protein